MAEYIEREALLKRLKFKRDTDPNMDGRKRYGLDSAISQVRKALVADVVEVRQGKWILEKERIYINADITEEINQKEMLGYYGRKILNLVCSNCNKTTMVDESIAYNYCPHCGARMDGAE